MKIGKGKNFKLKTPTCKALKRLNNLNESDSIAQHLPKDVTIELLPASNYAWLRVQSVAHNPVLRVKCTPQKRLITLIQFLEQRWNKLVRRTYLSELHTGRLLTDADAELEQTNKSDDEKKLRLRPHPALTKNMTSVRLLRHQTPSTHSQTDLSLNAYLSKANSWPENKKKRNLHHLSAQGCSKKVNRDEQVSGKLPIESKTDAPTTVHSELSPDSTDKSNISPIIETVRSLNVLNNIVSSSCEDPARSESPDYLNECSVGEAQLASRAKQREEAPVPPPNVTIGEWLSGNTKRDSATQEELDKKRRTAEAVKSVISIEEELCRTIDVNVVRSGWTVDQTDELTIGELCLLFKSKGKLVLQYDWDFVTPIPTKSVLSRLISAASIALDHFNKEHEEVQPLLNSPVKNGRQPSMNANARKNKRFRTLDLTPAVGLSDDLKAPSTPVGLPDETDKELPDPKSDTQRTERFVIPSSPAPRPSTAKQQPKNRIVNEALLQEAKDQLNGKFTTRRLSRKPTIVKPQQYHLSLNANQILGTNLRQLLAGKGISNQTYVSASTDSPALISMIAAAANGQSSQSNNLFIRQNQSSNKTANHKLAPKHHSPSSSSVTAAVATQEHSLTVLNSADQEINLRSESATIEPQYSSEVDNLITPPITEREEEMADRLIDFGRTECDSGVKQNAATIHLDSETAQNNDLQPKPPSPQSLSCLLDMSLGESGGLFNDSTDKFFFSSLMQSSSSTTKNTPLSTPTKAQIEQQQDSASTVGAIITPFQMHFNRLNAQIESEVQTFDSVNQPHPSSATTSKSSIGQMMHLEASSLTGSSSAWLHNVNSDLSLNNLFDCNIDPSSSGKHHTSNKSISQFTMMEPANQSVEVKLKNICQKLLNSLTQFIYFLFTDRLQLQSNESMSISNLINDSSIDLMSKFVDLTDKLAD
jgi:hypothetical protein